MMTIVTHVRVKEGAEPEWDAAMRERLEAARERPGWVAAQLLMPLDGLSKRSSSGPGRPVPTGRHGMGMRPSPRPASGWRASRRGRPNSGGTR